MGYRIGIDVGGTFTDFVIAGPAGGVSQLKLATTLPDQSVGVMDGIARLARQEGRSLPALLADTELLAHATTTADNTMIEMDGARTGLLTTQGQRDAIEIRRGFKEDIWDPTLPPPAPIARRRHRIGVPGRLDFRGRVVRELDEEAVRAGARRLARDGVESVAVCLLFSFVDPSHELRVREILERECPGVRVSLSHEVMPSAPEFERTSTTLVDAFVGPRVTRYLERLERALREAGHRRELLVMQSAGGVTTASFMARTAVAALGSGPTAGVMGACTVGRAAGQTNFVAVDMGGTSYEACLVEGGQPKLRSRWNWRHRYLVGLPMLEMHSIGAGGGSIARVEAGALKVGPDSAKADPGPICYGRGGTRATVTDANLVLGYVNPEALCGGEFKLRAEGVREALLEQVGRPLGLDAEEAAQGVFRIVNANMANAIRRVSSEAGLDPREFSMLVYGGNGPVHATMQAYELGMRRLLVPKTSPAFSALGLLLAERAVDLQRSYIVASGGARAERVNDLLDQMEERATTELQAAGVSRDEIAFDRYLGVCYPGQTFDMPVPAVTTEGRMSGSDLERTFEAFHALHEELHTYAVREQEPVLRAVRVHARASLGEPQLPHCPEADAPLSRALRSRRPACFEGRFRDTPVYDGDRLGRGHRIEGPAIVEERFTTLVLHPGQAAELDVHGNYVVTLS